MKLPKWLPKIGKVLKKILEVAIALKGAGLLNKKPGAK